MARVKQIIGWTAIVLFAATLAGIWVLTEQNAVETSLLSESTARVVEGQATGVQAADVAGEAQAENGMTGGTDSAASNVRSGRLASIRMVGGHDVRRVAHTVVVFLRRYCSPRWSWFAFQASVERMLPLRARVALLRRLLRWRSGT